MRGRSDFSLWCVSLDFSTISCSACFSLLTGASLLTDCASVHFCYFENTLRRGTLFHLYWFLNSKQGFVHRKEHDLPCPFFSSVQFTYSVMSGSLWSQGLQHARPPCPSPTPGVYSNSCPLSQWWHPTISSSVILFSSRLQYFPASESFSSESLLRIRWSKYWSFSFSHQSFQWIFRTDFL